MYIYINIYMLTYTRSNTHTHKQTRTLVSSFVYASMRRAANAEFCCEGLCICVYRCLWACKCTHIHLYICKCTHRAFYQELCTAATMCDNCGVGVREAVREGMYHGVCASVCGVFDCESRVLVCVLENRVCARAAALADIHKMKKNWCIFMYAYMHW